MPKKWLVGVGAAQRKRGVKRNSEIKSEKIAGVTYFGWGRGVHPQKNIFEGR